MKPFQLSITLSLVALALALLSVAMQIDWNNRDSKALAVTAEQQETNNAGETTMTPSTNRATSISNVADTHPRDKPNPLEEKVARLEQQLYGLHRLIRASGLDQAVPMWSAYPEDSEPLFEQLGKEAASRARFEKRREELDRKAADIRDNDYLRYGPERYRELEELYRTARPSRGPDTEQGKLKRTEALDEMIEEFPDAYETGVAVAEQALREALDGNTDQVAAHLQTLSETSPHTNIVTEQGMEAIPTIQTFLARQYIDQNRIEDASRLLNQLAENYPDSLIVEPSPGNVPSSPRTALEIATELQQQLGSPE